MTVWSLTPLGYRAELDILELRLATLDPVVDIHVISEADRYYSGARKPYWLDLDDARWEWWQRRMRVLHPLVWKGSEVRREPLEDAQPCDSDRWVRENQQRAGLRIKPADDDIVLLSDLDEIPRPETIMDAAQVLHATDPSERLILRPRLAMHSVALGWRWPHAVEGICSLMTGRTFRSFPTAQHARNGRGVVYGDPNDPSALGWHLAAMGGVGAVQCKIRNAAHHELDRHPFNTREWIEDCMRTGKDLFGRPDRQCDLVGEGQLPAAASDARFAHLWCWDTVLETHPRP